MAADLLAVAQRGVAADKAKEYQVTSGSAAMLASAATRALGQNPCS
jgi:hypothetical protein